MQGFAALLAYVLVIVVFWLLDLWLHREPRSVKSRSKRQGNDPFPHGAPA